MSIQPEHFEPHPHILLTNHARKAECRLSAQGLIQVHVYTSRANTPLPDVSVSISQKYPDGQKNLISMQTTDTSGNTKPVLITTPNLSDSQTPGNGTPFAVVDIAVDLPLFERVVIDDVQVFPNTLSIQDIQLQPRDALPSTWGDSLKFQVPPQNL